MNKKTFANIYNVRTNMFVYVNTRRISETMIHTVKLCLLSSVIVQSNVLSTTFILNKTPIVIL